MDDQLIKNIKKLKIDEGLNNKGLADILGTTEAIVKNYMRGKTDMPDEYIKILSSKYGVTLKEDIPAPSIRKLHAARTVTSNFRASVRTLFNPIIERLHEAVYELFEVEGSSMEKTFSQGDWLLCRAESLESMKGSRIYALLIEDENLKEYRPSGIWVKRCSYREETGYVTCKSDNKDTTEPYSTFQVRASHIKEVWYPVLRVTAQMADPNRDLYDKIDELESRIEMIESHLDLEQ